MGDKRIILWLLLFGFVARSQAGFDFEGKKDKVVIPFQLINNLVFIPVKVNGVPLNFLLDTGVEETILLSLDDKSKINLPNVQKVKLRGLGNDEPIEGLKSTHNVLSMNGLTDHNHDLYIVLDQSFNFSTHIGIPINGIIGYHFFKNNLVEINYDKKKIIVRRDSEKLRRKIAQRFTEFPITIEKNKPYIVADIAIGQTSQAAKMLLDLGNSDAVWLFENKDRGIIVPERNFEDYLGKGFSGDISGSRARISGFSFGNFSFKDPIIAFPDSSSVKSVTMVRDRAGSVGGEIFRRFSVIFDYRGKKMFLKKSSHYQAKFDYNMSGIDLQNEGMQLVKEAVPLETTLLENTYDSDGKKNSFKYKFVLKPLYTISNVRKDSPAALCGLQRGDVVVSIDGVTAYKYSLQQINELLKSEDGKWLFFKVDRDGQILKFSFQLKSML